MSIYSLIGMASYSASIGYGITTAAVGIILMLARILDGFTDPMLAFVYDRVNTRFGKLRILLISGYLIEAVGPAVYVQPVLQQGLRLASVRFDLHYLHHRLYRHQHDRPDPNRLL